MQNDTLHITLPVIGLTGGIGSGKSTMAELFSERCARMIYADDLAKDILWNDETVHEQVAEMFGKSVCDENGRIVKEKLADMVFQDQKSVQKLNAVIHPAVVRKISDIVRKTEEDRSHTLIVVEAALIYEAGIEGLFDMIISVVAPEKERIARIVRRDNTDEKSVIVRINQQLPEKVHFERSDIVIKNDTTSEQFKAAARGIIDEIFRKLK